VIFLLTLLFGRRCVYNASVEKCGNLILANFVGYDILLFHERCYFLAVVSVVK